jgi:hypothetical protein
MPVFIVFIEPNFNDLPKSEQRYYFVQTYEPEPVVANSLFSQGALKSCRMLVFPVTWPVTAKASGNTIKVINIVAIAHP